MKKLVQLTYRKDSAGEYRWQIKHGNGRILAASSEGFSSRSGARRNLSRLVAALELLGREFTRGTLSPGAALAKHRSDGE